MKYMYIKISLLLLTFLILSVTLANAENITDLMNLEKFLMQQNPKKLRPIVNQGEPVTVNINVFILALLHVDQKRQTLELSFVYNMTWKDELLTWNPGDYDGINTFVPETKSIWMPLLSCYNCLEMNIFKDEQSPVTINHDGLVVWQPRKKFEVFCSIKVRYFPMDEQICVVKFFPLKHSYFEVMLKGVSKSVNKAFYVENGEWEIPNSYVNSQIYEQSRSSVLNVTLIMKRRPLFFLLNIVTPIVLLSFLNLFTFCLPDDSGEKILFSLTMLLSQTVFQSTISSSLPANSLDAIYITYYITSLLLISCLITIASIILLYFHHKRKKRQMWKGNENQGSQHREALPNTQGVNRIYVDTTEDQVSKENGNEALPNTQGVNRIYVDTTEDQVLKENGNEVLPNTQGVNRIYIHTTEDQVLKENGNEVLPNTQGVNRIYIHTTEDQVLKENGNEALPNAQGVNRIYIHTTEDQVSKENGNEALPNAKGVNRIYVRTSESEDIVSKDNGNGEESSSSPGVVNNEHKYQISTKVQSFKPKRKKCCNCTMDMIIFCMVFIFWAGLTMIFLLKIIYKDEGYGKLIGNIH